MKQRGQLGITAGPDVTTSTGVAEETASQIARIPPASLVTPKFAVPTPNSQPEEITAGPDGNLWFTEFSGNQIGRITTAGIITEFAIPTPASVPVGITAGPDGNLCAAVLPAQTGNQIGFITPATVTISEFPANNNGPNAFTAAKAGRLHLVAEGIV